MKKRWQKQWGEITLQEKITGTFGLIIILAVIIVGAHSVFGSSNKKSKTPGPSSASSQQTTAPTPPPITPKQYTGTGDDVITIDKPTNSPAILKFDCPGCSDNTTVKTNGADSLLVNTVGAYSGSHIIDTASGSNTTQVTITADSAWTLSLSGLDQAIQVDNQAVSGQGDSVLYASGDTTKAMITNTGDDNFVVNVYPSSGGYANLAVNTIGSYSGTVPLQTPSYVQITSNGNWSVTPE